MWKKLKKAKLGAKIGSYIHQYKIAFDEKYNVSEKVQLLNEKANKHPKMTFSFSIIFILLMIVLSLVEPKSNNKSLGNIITDLPLESVLQKKQSIDQFKLHQQQIINNYTLQAKQLKSEIDSIISLPTKTHTDTITLYRKCKQLNYIIKAFNNENQKN